MPSTFRELFDDFRSAINTYTDDVQVDELQFMRYLSSGIQQFQERTEVVEASGTISVQSSGNYVLPYDCNRLIKVYDSQGTEYILQDYQQFIRQSQLAEPYGTGGFNPRRYSRWDGATRGICGVYNRVLNFYPKPAVGTITIDYIPNLEPISKSSDQWKDWYKDSGGNFDATRFDLMFESSTLSFSLAMYERYLVDYAIAQYLKSINQFELASQYEGGFFAKMEQVRIEKPTYFREGQVIYQLATKFGF